MSNKLKYSLGIIVGIIVIIGLPFVVDWLIIGNEFPSNIANTDWVSFLSGYISAIIGSIVSMIGIIITIHYTSKQNKRDRENQVRPYCTVRFVPVGKGVSVHNTLARIAFGCGEKHDNPEYYKCLIFVKNIGLGPAIEFKIDVEDFDDGRERYGVLWQHTPQAAYTAVNSLRPGEESTILLSVDFNFDEIPDEEVTSEYEEIIQRNVYEVSDKVLEKYKNYQITINIKYHDMYENMYLQKVTLKSEINPIIDKDGHAQYTGGYSLVEKTIPQRMQ